MSEPPSPWKEFLSELDALLEEPIELHCIGGFAAVVGYDLPRSTNDLDYRTILPYNRMNDLVLSKLSRNFERDRQDVQFLSKTLNLDPALLRERYEKELKVNLIGPQDRHDATLKFWLEAFFAEPKA